MRRLLPVLAAAVSGVAAALAFPTVISAVSLRQLDPRGWTELLAWVALVPAFLVLRACRRARQAFWLGLLAGVVFFFSAIYWVGHAMTAFGGLPLWLSLLALTLLVLYCAAHWAIAFGVAARVRDRLGWPLWAVLPPIWVATELLRNHLFSGFPWANLGYTQVRTLPVAQLAALAGPYGIAALVVLVNGALAEVVAAVRERRRVPWRPPAVAGAALVLAVGWGWMHLASVRAEMARALRLSVGVVQPNVDQARTNSRQENEAYILQRLVPPTQEADQAGADLVVWPEAIYPRYPPSTLSTFAVRGSGVPPLARAHLVAGVYSVDRIHDPGGRRRERVANMLFLVAPDLSVQARYTKLHLVPFGEYIPAPVRTVLPFLKQVVPIADDASPGVDYTVFSFRPSPAVNGAAADAAEVRLAPLICYDAIFPEITGRFMRTTPPPDLLVNSTNDAWYGYSSAPYQFLAIVQLRAIEARRTVIRSAVAGVSAVILPTGELAPGAIEVGPVDPDLAPDRNEPARLLLADAPRLQGRTLYTTIGDLFAYACALLAAGAWAATWRRARIARASPSPRRQAEPASSSGSGRGGANITAR